MSYYGAVFRLARPDKAGRPWTFRTLYSFHDTGDGARPTDGLIFDGKGNLYGTTSDSDAGGYGEIFELVPPTTQGGEWTETILYHFRGGTDGATPLGGLISDEKGNLYGTTIYTVFELSPPTLPGGAWTFSLLHEFKGGTGDGTYSHAGLVRDRWGNLYGTTLWGGYEGNPHCGEIGCGTVFELSPPAAPGGDWTERVIHFFGMGDDGFNPEGGLALGAHGVLYGTTYSGGRTVGGTAFQLTPPREPRDAWTETIIHNFSYSRDDGAAPVASMILDGEGNLYGTTLFGGTLVITTAHAMVVAWSSSCRSGIPMATRGTKPCFTSFRRVGTPRSNLLAACFLTIMEIFTAPPSMEDTTPALAATMTAARFLGSACNAGRNSMLACGRCADNPHEVDRL